MIFSSESSNLNVPGMTQDETNNLLRPRVAGQTAVIVSRESLQPETTSTPRRSRRRRLLRCLLVGAALYASFLLCLSASRVGLLKGADGSSAASTFRSAMNAVAREANQFQLMRMEFLTGSLNDQDEPRDEVATVEQPKQQIEEKSNSKSSIEEAEEHARSVKMLPANDSKKRRLKCIG
ncbi:hypothetical protein PF010_g5519 [Phytophthora fragariae]|nr:hypothetical protein PF010_g5519 [Phytophthora fragariae]